MKALKQLFSPGLLLSISLTASLANGAACNLADNKIGLCQFQRHEYQLVEADNSFSTWLPNSQYVFKAKSGETVYMKTTLLSVVVIQNNTKIDSIFTQAPSVAPELARAVKAGASVFLIIGDEGLSITSNGRELVEKPSRITYFLQQTAE